jgi:hypothetical protein
MSNRPFKTGESRHQPSLLPPRVEDYVGPNNAVRAIESYVGALDLAKLGFRHANRRVDVGQPPYDPGAGDGGDDGDIGAKVSALMAKRSRAEADLARLEASGETQLSLTDPDARLLVKNGQASQATMCKPSSTTSTSSLSQARW